MPWLRLDDKFDEHPKIAAAGDRAELLHIHGLLYCNRNLTDGFIPSNKTRGMLQVDPARSIERLVELGIWQVVGGGFQIHDYLDYQPSKAQVLAEREQKASAGQAGGQARARNLLKQSPSTSQAEGLAESKPVPVPVPVPVDPKSTLETKALSPDVPKKRPSESELSPEQTTVAIALEGILGHQLSPIDVQACGVWLQEFQHLNAESIIARMHSHVADCEEKRHRLPKTAMGFRESLRLENDFRATRGKGQRSSTSSDFSRIGDLLGRVL